MYSKWLAWIVLGVVPLAAADEDAIAFKGYYKNLLTHSRTIYPAEENFTLDLNRLRIEAQGQLPDWLSYDIQYDNEVFLGSYLDTAQFQITKTLKPNTYWDLEDDYADRGSLYARHRLYRGYVTIKSSAADVFVGRQRIAWGTGRFWNPTDLFNPLNPIQLEREERTGVDAVLAERSFGPLTKLSAAYAPTDSYSNSAIRFSGNTTDTDFSVMTGRFQRDHVFGFDLAGHLGQSGIRAEATRTQPDLGNRYTRAVIGAEYAFQNTLTLSGEYYYNGAGAVNRLNYDFPHLLAGDIQNVARHYIGGYAKYEFTPLLRTENYVIVNLDDNSRFVAPALIYSVTSNLEWAVGVQLFHGDNGSEYGALHNVYYTQLQWFF